MKNKVLTILLFFALISSGQEIIEIPKLIISEVYKQTFKNIQESKTKDSSLYKGIMILENGLENVNSKYEKYRITFNLGTLYSLTKQYNKAINLWNKAHELGIILPFFGDSTLYPEYLNAYNNNDEFKHFYDNNLKLRKKANKQESIEFFVNLPQNYDSSKLYPLILILHGKIDDGFNAYTNWKSKCIHEDFISIYPNGREILSSFARDFGQNGVSDISQLITTVINKYPIDTNKIIYGGQSLGGQLALNLAKEEGRCKGVILALSCKTLGAKH